MPVLYILKDSDTERQQLGKYIDGVDELSFNCQFIFFVEEYLDLREHFKEYSLPYLKKIDDRDIAYNHSIYAYDFKNIDCCLMNYKQLEKIDKKSKNMYVLIKNR